MAIDIEKIEEHVKGILIALGDDINREGIKDTPKRVAKMFSEVFDGMNYSNEEIAKMFDKTFEDDIIDENNSDMVQVKNIEVFSYCEHHLALMYDLKVSVAYVPKGKVVGLSKIVRIVDMVAKRLQLQERIGRDIIEVMKIITGTEDIAVSIEGFHSCMTARGIKNQNSKTYTTNYSGAFVDDFALQSRLR